MAKFKLKASVIPILEAKGIIDGSGNMLIRLPRKAIADRERIYEVTFHKDDAIQIDERHAERALETYAAPNMLVDGEWIIMDPTVEWFELVADIDSSPAKQPHVHGTDVLHKRERRLLRRYEKATGAVIPDSIVRADVATHLTDARNYFQGV